MSSSQTSSSSSDPLANPFAGMLDVRCGLDVVVGFGSISVRECLRLQRGSVIRLLQPAGADLLIRIRGIATAKGEVVVEEESASIRVSEILAPPGIEAAS